MSENTKKQERTKKKLHEALIDLCSEGNYYNITINDICNRAGVYRSTFYRYYDNKDEMLREIEITYVEDTRKLTATVAKFKMNCTQAEFAQYQSELIQDMEYHRRHRQFSKFLLSPNGDPYFAKKMRESLTKTIEESMRSKSSNLGRNEKYMINFFVNGFMATLIEWLKSDDRTPKEIADFLIMMMTLFET